jgi:hypothetical protein
VHERSHDDPNEQFFDHGEMEGSTDVELDVLSAFLETEPSKG